MKTLIALAVALALLSAPVTALASHGGTTVISMPSGDVVTCITTRDGLIYCF